MPKSFEDQLYDAINDFRTEPSKISKKCLTVKVALMRFKTNKDFVNEIEDFIFSLKTMRKLKAIEKNEDLRKAAQSQMAKYLADPDGFDKFQEGKTMEKLVPDKYWDQGACLIADDGADTPEDVVTKMLLNKSDTHKIGRKRLTDNTFTQMGVAHSMKEGSNYVIIVFAKDIGDERVELPEGDLSELKQAFDLFDINKCGKIDIGDTLDSMRTFTFDLKNPELFKMLKQLQDKGRPQVDFPHFAAHIIGKISDKKNPETIRTIFNLCRDDDTKDEVTMMSMARIIKDLNDKDATEKLNKVLAGRNGSNAYITFDEFSDYMNRIYGDKAADKEGKK